MINTFSMEKIFPFVSPKEHYTADVTVVWCFDARFRPLFNAYLQSRGFAENRIDEIKCAGGARALAVGSPDRDPILEQVKKSVLLHNPQTVILMDHIDCGYTGGSKAFEGREHEIDDHRRTLQESIKTVREAIPGVTIEAIFADFEGVHLL